MVVPVQQVCRCIRRRRFGENDVGRDVPTEQLSLFGEQVGLTQVITNRKNLILKRPLISNLQKLIESNSTDYEEILLLEPLFHFYLEQQRSFLLVVGQHFLKQMPITLHTIFFKYCYIRHLNEQRIVVSLISGHSQQELQGN